MASDEKKRNSRKTKQRLLKECFILEVGATKNDKLITGQFSQAFLHTMKLARSVQTSGYELAGRQTNRDSIAGTG